VAPAKTQTARVILDSKAIGTVTPTQKFTLVPATGATVAYGQHCPGPDQSCDGIEARCQLWCNNPLVPQGGVAGFTCSCHWWWDSQQECCRYVCSFTCECVGLPEPPYHEPYIPWCDASAGRNAVARVPARPWSHPCGAAFVARGSAGGSGPPAGCDRAPATP